jgi:VWFA-related protein
MRNRKTFIVFGKFGMNRCRVSLRGLFLSLLFMVAVSAAPGALTASDQKQEPADPEYIIRANTRLVVLDIVATDAKDKTVTDLRPEEIRIYENGKEETKRDFSFLHPDAGNAPQRLEFHLPPDVYTNAPQYSGNSSFNIILFDVLHSNFANLAYAHDQIIRYLEKTPPRQPTAVYAMGNKLWLLHDFTTDSEALKESIRKFKGQGSKMLITSPDQGKTYTRKSTFTLSKIAGGSTLDAFRSLARIMAAYPGRKNLIWISESFISDLLPETAMGPMREVQETADAMMEAQIAVYPIDAWTLSGDMFTSGPSHFYPRVSMRTMAERTGGRAFTNRNDIDNGVRESIDDGSSYYTTSYQPANKSVDGRLRRIEVKCTRPGVKLRYRRGYYATNLVSHIGTKKDVRETSIDLAQSLDPDLPVATALLFRAKIIPPSDTNGNQAVINFNVDPHMVLFERGEDGLQHAKVSCVVWAYPARGNPVSSGGGTVNAALDEPTFNKVMSTAVPCRQTINLPPGNYMLRLGVIDQSTMHIGALTAWLTVPDPAEAVTQNSESAAPRAN